MRIPRARRPRCRPRLALTAARVALLALFLTGAAAPAQGVQKAPFETLPTPSDASPFLREMGERTGHAWLEGDVLHFAHRSAEGPIQLAGGIQVPLERVPGSDLWLTRLRWNRWPEAFASYTFIGPGDPGHVSFELWRGAASPEPPRTADAVQHVETIEMESAILGEKRSITVALPTGKAESLRAIIMADGQSAESWGKIVRPLIEQGVMQPVAIIGIHSVGYQGKRDEPYNPEFDIRGREYVQSNDPERFARHLRWVTDEVLPLVAERFGVSLRRENLAVAGFSNGGAFAASAGLIRPDVFGAVLAFSVGIPPELDRPQGALPKFRVSAGELESGFLKGSTTTVDLVRGWGGDATLRTFASGHDHAMWELSLATLAPEVFPGPALLTP